MTLEGGSGRATVESPAALTVADGIMTATIVWSSPNYDYMLVDGEKYLPVNTEGNSTFEIPVAALDTALAASPAAGRVRGCIPGSRANKRSDDRKPLSAGIREAVHGGCVRGRL